MKQKPILFLLMSFLFSAGIAMYPESGILTFSNKQSEEGTYPKNVNLGPLAINCPAPMVFAANANCMAQVIVSPPTSTCGNITSMTYTLPGNMPVTVALPPPATINLGFFPAGLFTIVWNVSDNCPPLPTTAVCNQLIKIDSQLPTITCPGNISVGNNPNGRRTANRMMMTPVEVAQPVVNDNCGIASITNDFNNTDDASGNYPLGTTPVCWLATDLAGNTASCCMSVTVYDDTPPVIICPDTLRLLCIVPAPYPHFLQFQAAGGSASDDIELDTSTFMFVRDTITSMTFPNKKTIKRYYKIGDSNGNMDTCFQVIIINDTVLPTISCPSNRDIDLNNNCSLTIPDYRPLVTTNDNCGITTLVQSPIPGTTITSSHNQQHVITFTVTDNAGLTAQCTMTVTAKDKLGPDVVCSQFKIVSLPNFTELPASSFVTSSTDNCGGVLKYTARRMGNVCGGNTPDDFGNYVQFCCDDVNDTLTIVVRVEDLRGNFTECMATAIIRDNLAPSITTPLPDISVSCEFPLNLNNLNIFGTLVPAGNVRQNIVINDPGHPFYPPAGLAGMDGVYTDNCPGALVTVSTRNQLSMCNTGQIKRDFTIKDAGNNQTTFTQTIYVIDVHPFSLSDITWPAVNVNYTDCNDPDPDTSVTGAPLLNGDRCSLVGATYGDQAFSSPNSCKLIKRTWTVVDWCQYQSNVPNSPGKWTFVQYINVVNNVAPVIGAKVCRDTVICAQNATCYANVTFSATGSDDCLPVNITWTYKIDLNNNGGAPDITGSGSTLSRQFDLGTHKLTWEAKDKCNNISSCSFLFTIRDCKAPNAIAMQGLAINVNPPSGTATIWASDFNNFSSDNCTPSNQLKYSFSANTNDTGRIFTCDSLGHKRIELWVTDLAGNQSKAVTFIDVQDNQHVCGSGNRIHISGTVFTENKINIPNTKVIIDGGETEGDLMTDNSGKYSFENLAMFNNYQLVPYKNTNHAEGITTLDLVMIQRHVLGLQKLSSPYTIIAADVNNSQSVTASDLVELRKLVLGIQTEFSKNTSWRFVDAGYSFDDPIHPWPFMEQLTYEELESNMSNSDFIAIKTGDVNHSASENYSDKTVLRNNGVAHLNAENATFQPDQLVSLTIKSDDLYQALGFQWTMELSDDVTYEGFESLGLPVKNENMALVKRNNKTYLTFSYDDMRGIKINTGEPLFNLILRPSKAGVAADFIKMNNTITPSLIIDKNEQEVDLQLVFNKNKIDSPSYAAQNFPNPFRDETQIALLLKEQGTVNCTIYDAKGTLISGSNENMFSGKHNITITSKQLGNKPGVYYVRIKSKDLNEVIKILHIE